MPNDKLPPPPKLHSDDVPNRILAAKILEVIQAPIRATPGRVGDMQREMMLSLHIALGLWASMAGAHKIVESKMGRIAQLTEGTPDPRRAVSLAVAKAVQDSVDGLWHSFKHQPDETTDPPAESPSAPAGSPS